MDVSHSSKNLLHEILYLFDRDPLILFLVVLDNVLKVLWAVLEDEVLGGLSIFGSRIVNFMHLHHILTWSKFIKNFVLARHIFSRLLCSFYRHNLPWLKTFCFENVTKWPTSYNSPRFQTGIWAFDCPSRLCGCILITHVSVIILKVVVVLSVLSAARNWHVILISVTILPCPAISGILSTAVRGWRTLHISASN